MRVTMIVAMDQANGIGLANGLLVHLPEDLAFFKQTTLGHHVVMGRKTFESIGRRLPGREMVVVTRSANYLLPEGVHRAESLEEALALCAGDEEVFITGGAMLYAEAMGRADRLIVTHIEGSFEADAYFPAIAPSEWRCVEEGERQESRTGWHYHVNVYERC